MTNCKLTLIQQPANKTKHFSKLCCFSVIALIALISSSSTLSAQKAVHGLSVFGPESLKYGPNEPFDYLKPDAPVAGELRLAADTFSKLTPFGLTGTAPAAALDTWEPLAIKSWDDDEPYAIYGLLAESFELADDRRSITITLRPEAEFSDGHPVTAEDVVFSYELLYHPAMNPTLRSSWSDVTRVEAIDERVVRVNFETYRRDLLTSLFTYTFQIYPKHIYGAPGVNLSKDFLLQPPIGSGPYEVESFQIGRSIRMVRRDDYWADGVVPFVQGQYNFKRMSYTVYYDEFSILQAFKSGHLDFVTNIAPDRFRRLEGGFFERNLITKEQLPFTRPAAMLCLIFNLRIPMFQDRELRKVINSLYDFQYINSNYYYGTHERIVSYFNNEPSLRASQGLADGQVYDLLAQLAKKYNKPANDEIYVPREAFTRGPHSLGRDKNGNLIPIDQRVLAASKRLDELGWTWNEEKGVRTKGNQALEIEILDTMPETYHFAETLRRAGIDASVRQLSALEQQSRRSNRRFDMIIGWFDGRKAPGRELARNFIPEDADVKGSANALGLKNPAIDELLSVMMTTESQEELSTYAQAFDRIMTANWYVVPLSWPKVKNLAYWSYLDRPDVYASGLDPMYNVPSYWYMDEQRYAEVQRALRNGTAIEQDTP